MQATIHGAAQLVTTQLGSGKLVRRHRCSNRLRARGLRRSREGRATRRSDERLAVGNAIQPRRVGRRFHLMINGLAFTAGIAEPGFRGLIVGTPSDLWIPGTAASGSTSQQRSYRRRRQQRAVGAAGGVSWPYCSAGRRRRWIAHGCFRPSRPNTSKSSRHESKRWRTPTARRDLRERLSLIDGEHGLSTLRERSCPRCAS